MVMLSSSQLQKLRWPAAVATRPRAQAVAAAIVARSIRARGRYAPHALTPSDASLTNQFS
jgi:hypothetical protein